MVEPLPAYKRVLFVFLPSLVAFVAMDVGWISMLGGRLYKETLGNYLRPQPDVVAGLGAWLCIVASLQLFALPAAKGQGIGGSFRAGALLGCFIYGTFELTSQSILTRWAWSLTFTDMAWGTFACAMATGLQHYLTAAVQKRTKP